jgi:hypothetical protein
MRSLPTALLVTLFITPAFAEERTWTISTGTYAMAAELVEIRGDIAYLKTGDRIEHIPLARLSAADMKYIETLSPAQIFPGPADEAAPATELPAPPNELNAAPPTGPLLNAPAAPVVQQRSLKPAIEPTTRLPQNPVRATNRSAPASEQLPIPRSMVRPANQSRRVDTRTLANRNTNAVVRPPTTAQRQYRNSTANRNRNRSRNEGRRGLFGLRLRRSRN